MHPYHEDSKRNRNGGLQPTTTVREREDDKKEWQAKITSALITALNENRQAVMCLHHGEGWDKKGGIKGMEAWE